MFRWFRTRLQAWVQRVQEKEIERRLEATHLLKALVLASNGGKPIRLTADERRRLDGLRKNIDPEVLKRIDLLADAE
jgi:hypothetical protein